MVDDDINRTSNIADDGSLNVLDLRALSDSSQRRTFEHLKGARRMAVMGGGNQNK